MDDHLKDVIRVASRINKIAPRRYVPPSNGASPKSEMILPHALVAKSRNYIKKVTFQINGCYENGWFDGCLVLMRRLIETLIIECYDNQGKLAETSDPAGNILMLEKLIGKITSEPALSISRNSKKCLNDIKALGDQSAHNRTFTAFREDIDNVRINFRSTVQNLLTLAKQI